MSCPLNRNKFRGSGYRKGDEDVGNTEAAREMNSRLQELMASRDAMDQRLTTNQALVPASALRTEPQQPKIQQVLLPTKFLQRLRAVATACLPTAQTAEDVRLLRQITGFMGSSASREELKVWYDLFGRCETVVDFRILPQIGMIQEDLLDALSFAPKHSSP